MIDFARGVRLHEVVVELWEPGSSKRRARRVVTMREGEGQGVAEQIAVSDDVIVLNRDRMLQLT